MSPPSISPVGGAEGGVEPEEKEEKVYEALDGDTMHGEAEDEGGWSVGHGTLASQAAGSSSEHGLVVGTGVMRSGSSANRQRSTGSTVDQGRQQVIPPPYSVYIPPDTKHSPPQ